MTAFTFNARSVEPDQGRVGAVPKGWYPSMVKSTEIKLTNGGDGAYILVSAQILAGPHKDAMWFVQFNIKNASEKALEIAQKQLSALCHAVNVLDMTDTDQLKNIPFFVRLKFVDAEKNPDGTVKYDEKNEPTAFRNQSDQAAIEAFKAQGAAASGPKASVAPPAPAPAAAPSWGQQPPAAAVHAAQTAPVNPPAWTAPADAPSWGGDQASQAAPAAQAPPAEQTAPNAPPPWAQ